MANSNETSKDMEKQKAVDINNKRHNDNARAAADNERLIPRINTDNL